MNQVNKGARIVNYVIDSIAIVIVYSILSLLFSGTIQTILYYLVYLLYYFILEYLTGQTLGKMLTGTIVLDKNNLKPGFRKVLYRTLLRFNPFDVYSYLFGQEQGGHDLLSKTCLKIKVKL